MYIVISGDAVVKVSCCGNWEHPLRLALPEELEQLDGVDCPDNFMEYFNPWRQPELKQRMKEALSSGYMSFKYDKERIKLVTETYYEANRKLSSEEEKALIQYTQGQWSDGIGEGFEQNPVRGKFYISPWYHGQVVVLTYEE